ncbi:MAG: hypothetical protein V4591_00190 [Bdellovibrionota bacterium]
MKNKILKYFLIFYIIFYVTPAYTIGFTANWVDIVRLNNGMFRVLIKYTNLQIGEYREAYVDFTSKKEAIEVFQKLAQGATFFWGDSKKIFFPKEVEKPKPY